ncbi:MAG: cytochrome P460 family protein [Cyclobacteriaceae bacterium]
MKAKNSIYYLALVFTLGLFFQACNEDEEEETNPEFVASSADFANFRSWTEVAMNVGPDPSLGAAHGGNDENVTRTIYVKDDADRNADGEFPVGTLVVKDTKDGEGNHMEVTAMVKRGNGFNPNNNDWEWFMLTQDGEIAQDGDMVMRGATLMEGMCGSCHSQAASQDYLFSK